MRGLTNSKEAPGESDVRGQSSPITVITPLGAGIKNPQYTQKNNYQIRRLVKITVI